MRKLSCSWSPLTKLAEETPHRTRDQAAAAWRPLAIEGRKNRAGHLLRGGPPELCWADRGAHGGLTTMVAGSGQARDGWGTPRELRRSRSDDAVLKEVVPCPVGFRSRAPLFAAIAVMPPAGGASSTEGPLDSIAFAPDRWIARSSRATTMSMHPVSRDMNRPSYAPKNALSIERTQAMPGADRNPGPTCKYVFGATDFAPSRARAAARDLKSRVICRTSPNVMPARC